MANKEAKTKKENSKNKKSFFKDFKAELKKVNWLTPKQLLNNTVAVITIVIITAVIVFILDVVFETINKHGIDKIKEVIVTDNTTSNETETNSTEENTNSDTTVEETTEENTNTETSVENTTEQTTETSNEQNTTENSAE